ncbi:MAG TPA: hypothetical protein VMI54_14800 [Polyangiaceae bacterium]|nr:hypothetical protein [Polyangiaceae bacterium]
MSDEPRKPDVLVKAPPREERRARLMIGAGAASLFAGITLAVTDDDTGRWLILAGVVVLFVALHRFGRLGPEDATV